MGFFNNKICFKTNVYFYKKNTINNWIISLENHKTKKNIFINFKLNPKKNLKMFGYGYGGYGLGGFGGYGGYGWC